MLNRKGNSKKGKEEKQINKQLKAARRKRKQEETELAQFKRRIEQEGDILLV